MEPKKPRKVKPWLRRIAEEAGALDAMPRVITSVVIHHRPAESLQC
jgi:hypothetical protein